MKIPVGFKKSDVGFIPEDWGQSTIGGHVKALVAGVSVNSKPGEAGGDLSVPNVLKTSAVTGGRIILSEAKPIADRDLGRAKTPLRADSLIISRMNTPALVGECGYTSHAQPNLFLPDRLWLAEFKQGDETSARWLTYLLASPFFASRIKAEATGTSGTMKNIPKGAFLSLPIPYPQPSEQRAIAAALAEIDHLITSLDALIAKKRDIKQAAMQQLLTGKTRLPPFAKTSMVHSEIGELPEDWQVRSLASLGEPLIGLTYRPSDVRDTGTLVLRSSNVQDGTLSFEDNVFVDPKVATRALVIEGDILICVRNGSRGLIGKCAIIDDRASGMAFGAFMAVFRSPYSAFLHHQFQSNTIQKQIHEHLGATINQITNASLRSFKVPFPKNADERSAIVAILSDIGSELSALDDEVSKLRAVREGMMQQLLTGRIRLV